MQNLRRIFGHKILLLYFSALSVLHNINFAEARGPPWRILFLGSDHFSLETLETLNIEFKSSKKLISQLDVTSVDDETPVASYARRQHLPFNGWPLLEDECSGKYDVGILVSFGEMISKEFIDCFPFGIINAHPSLLPRWRGASPIPHAIMHGDNETGVSIMSIKPDKFDHGDVILQTRTPIKPDETTPQLETRLKADAAKQLMGVIKDLKNSISAAKPQSEENATEAPKLYREMSWIVWENMTSDDIFNRHRALAHIWPIGTIYKSYVVKLLTFRVKKSGESSADGILAEAEVPTTIKIPHKLLLAGADGGEGEDVESTTRIGKKSAHSAFGKIERPSQQNIGPDGKLKPGAVMFDKNMRALRVMCMDGAQLLVYRVTVSRRKTMDALSFHNGFLSRTKPEERIFSEYSHFKGADAINKTINKKSKF